MFKNYFKTAFRNLWRHKAFSAINIFGLAIGMTACLLISLYIRFELSYDQYNKKADRIYRVITDVKTPTEMIHAAITSAPMGPNIKADFPEVEAMTRISQAGFLIQKGDEKVQENSMLYADSTIFSLFSFPLIKGDPAKALTAPFSMVLSETGAHKYFGSADPMGQSLLLDGKYNAIVTGIMHDIPVNSHFKADILISMSSLQTLNPYLNESWGNFGWYTYLLLPENVNIGQLQVKFTDFMNRHVGDQMKKNNMYYSLYLQRLKDIYLHSKREMEAGDTGNLSNIYIFSIIAVFILLIACINFVNLTTARSSERAKEVGVRKVAGAAREQLALQFLGESVILSVIAFLLAAGLSALLIPLFNELCGKIISQGIFQQGSYLGILLLIAVGVGLLAGIYPAVVLSGFRPVSVLKGKFASGKRGAVLRKTLVVSQFIIAIVLIAGTMIVYSQLHFMRSQPLGFKKDNMLVVNFNYDSLVQHRTEMIKHELMAVQDVLSASVSIGIPGGNNDAAFTLIENNTGEMQSANIALYSIDFDYLKQYQIPVVAGREFSNQFPTDSTQAMVVNEAAVKGFGYSSPKDIIGKKFSQWGRSGVIIGVIKNFHFRSLQEEIKPLTIRIAPDNTTLLSLNISANNIPSTVAAIEKKWKQLVPNRPFDYFFTDESFNKQYLSDERFGRLFLYFAGLAIVISCLGLLGLASYTTTQRTKEIGVRKVLGASVGNLVGLLSRDFLKLVIISAVVAFPVAWWFMNKWLQDFAYRTHIGWWIFIIAGLLALLVALATISFQSIKAAITNPVKSLRTE
ncbi:MAG: ABC transporter permease [Bacteroidota bacterium]|nr:ABC transporter permease [Bacteroidota bacterium]